MKKKVLITGIAGMIGSHLGERLIANGYSVVGIDNLSFGKIDNIEGYLDNKNFKFYKVDVLNLAALNKIAKGLDIIVHLAALKKPSENDVTNLTLRVNAEGTRNILEVALRNEIKVVFASTSDVYGNSNQLPFKESSDLVVGPTNIRRWNYAVSKIYAEQMVFSYYKDFSVPIVILRYFGCFSARSNPNWSGGHIPIFINAVLKDEEIIIHGDGKQTRCMAYIDDIIDGTISAIEKPAAVGEIFNIGSEEEYSIIDSAFLIHKLADTGKKIKLRFMPTQEIFGEYREIARRVPDISKAKNILGFLPKVSFTEALRLTIELRKKELGVA